MNNFPLVYVITINWNNWPVTRDFLEHYQQLTYPNYRLLVVDNGSTDGSPGRVAEQFPHIEQIYTGQNLGFAAGMNVGITQALAEGAKFIFLANNDTTVQPDILEHLVAAAQTSQVALVSPVIYYSDEPTRIWSAGAEVYEANLELKGNRKGQIDNRPEETRPYQVQFVTACGLLITAECVQKVGLLDEQFFMYYEDSDYSRRVQAHGLHILVAPQAKMWHIVSATIGGVDTPAERYHMARSSVRFFRKHGSNWRMVVIIPYRLGSALKTSVRLVRHGRWPALRAYWQGLWDGVVKK